MSAHSTGGLCASVKFPLDLQLPSVYIDLMNAAAKYDTFENIDALSQPATVEVKGANLREGMVIVDELGCPSAGLDHRIRAERNSGSVAFLVNDFDRGGYRQDHFHRNVTFRVVAK
jgi:hypothetical protein